MKKLHWITISYYVDIDTGEQITQHLARKFYVITKKEIHKQNTAYVKQHEKVVGLYNYEGVTTIINECTRNGKQQRLFDD